MKAALQHLEPDVVPRGENAFDHTFFREVMGRDTLCYGGWEELFALWAGERDRVVQEYVTALAEMTVEMGWDYIRVPAAPRKADYSGYRRVEENSFTDGLGKTYHFNPDCGNVVSPGRYNTEQTIADIDLESDFFVAAEQTEIAEAVVDRMGKSHFIIGKPPIGGTFPYLDTVGMEELLVRMITEPDFVHRVADVAATKFIAYADAFIDAGCDAVMETEDYADNRGLLMGLDRYQEFIQPYLKRICDHVHSRGAFFIKHGDGVMWEALDSFVSMGVDGWHGIQPSLGLEIGLLKERYAGRLCLFGGMNVETLISGPVQEVENEVRRAITDGARGGGLILTSGNVLEPGVRLDHYRAAMDVWARFGEYPVEVPPSE